MREGGVPFTKAAGAVCDLWEEVTSDGFTISLTCAYLRSKHIKGLGYSTNLLSPLFSDHSCSCHSSHVVGNH